jgi:Beta-lactamase enzyme family
MNPFILALALTAAALTGTPAMCAAPPADGASAPVPPTPPPNLITRLLAENPGKFAKFTDNPAKYKLQILLSVVDDTDPRHPTLTRHGYRLEEEYFYPASTIKIFASAAALIRLDGIREETNLPIRHDTPMVIHPLFDDEQLQDADPSNTATGKITVEHEIRKTLLVSSNAAYNHLFEFVGHEHLHLILRHAGLPGVRLNHRLSEFRSREDNRLSPRIDFVLDDGTTFTIPRRTSNLITDNTGMAGLNVGDGYIKGDQLIKGPMGFHYKNHASLQDLQDFLIKIVRPDIPSFPPPAEGASAPVSPIPPGPLPLTNPDRAILLSALSQHPHESKNPVYTEQDISKEAGYPLFQPGIERLIPREDLLIYAKGGTAYGFRTENAVITHKPTGQTFALAATVYVNEDGILNDDQYNYDLADQLMADLGEAVARELWESP